MQRPEPRSATGTALHDSSPDSLAQIPFGTDDFAENPEPRVPCVLLLDVSTSMQGRRINELNAGLATYRNSLIADSLASRRVEVAIITFGHVVHTVCDFTTAGTFSPPTLEAHGLTPMGEAVDRAITMVEQRKETYRANGIAYYRPWIFLITDGGPNDRGWQDAARRAVEGENNRSFAFFAVGVEDADFEVLRQFSVRQPLRLNGLRFSDLFEWLSNSQQNVSRSTPGEAVALENPTGPDGWASIA